MADSNSSMPSVGKNLPTTTKKQKSEDLNDREKTSETPLPPLKSPTMPQEDPDQSMRPNQESFDSSSTELQGASKSTHSIKLETHGVKGEKSSDSVAVSQNPNIDASLAKQVSISYEKASPLKLDMLDLQEVKRRSEAEVKLEKEIDFLVS